MAAVSLATQTYGVATDLRSASTQASDTAIEAQIKTALLTSPLAGTSGIIVYCRQGQVVLAAACRAVIKYELASEILLVP